MIKYYRRLLTTGFVNAGSLENPSIYLDPVAEGTRRICGRASDYMHIFINIRNDTIDTIKYLCVCDPTVNVAVEAFSNLVKGKTLKEAANMKEDEVLEAVGSKAEYLKERVTALLEVINKGINRYQETLSQNSIMKENTDSLEPENFMGL